jgi:hypothetical protein
MLMIVTYSFSASIRNVIGADYRINFAAQLTGSAVGAATISAGWHEFRFCGSWVDSACLMIKL